MPPEIEACLPARLHPVSRMFLEAFLKGSITQEEFLADCIVKALSSLQTANPTLHL
jgi:hypothetical protein